MQMGFSNKKKMKSEWQNFIFCKSSVFVLTVLEVLGKTHMSVHGNNEAFIQANSNDVRFLERQGGLQEFMHKDVAKVRISPVHSDFESDNVLSSSVHLKFVPPKLDFKERYLGVPHLQKVTLVNTDENKTIHMSSVSGNTVHFHSSFFQDKIIPPQGNTTFAVVFLGRTEGPVSSSLYIHTSEGIFKYQVSGASIGSPYRLKPLEGVRLPLNAAFQPLIQLHNPHHYPIQVVEVYSSGSDFNLELPGGEVEGPKTLWEVPPYTTKPVIKAKFLANIQRNHTAYIRLKLNNSEEVLVVPVGVEVTSQPGLYSHHHFIDFGIGGSQDKPKSLNLYLCNSFKKTLRIQSVSVVPESPVLKINFKEIKIPSGISPVEVATLTFDWKAAFETNITSGKILIKTKQSQYRLGIPYTATVLQGGLSINESITRFLTTSDRHSARNLTVTNQFEIPIAINNFTLFEEAANYFEIKKFKPLIIPPKQSAAVLTISPKTKKLIDVNLVSGLVLFTNISDVTVSLLSYNGKLTKIFPIGFEDLELLDVGLIGSGSSKLLRFGLQNNNPVSIEILSVQSHSPLISLQILGIFSGNASEFLTHQNFSNLTRSAQLKPSRILVIEVIVQASDNEEVISSQITVLSQYEKLTIPVRIAVAQGALKIIPSRIVLDDCFPGKICTQPLKVQSTFNRPMSAILISSVPPDCRMSFVSAPGGSEILPSSTNYIGDLRWEPGKICGSHCYLGLSLNSSGGLQWMQNELLSSYISDVDATLLRDKYHRLLNYTNGFGSGYWQDLILRLETNEVREELFTAQVKLIWPKFSNTSKLVFPLTQVTNTTVQRIKLYNPASQKVVLQVVTEWAYPLSKRLLDSFPPSFASFSKENCLKSSVKEFFISPGISDSFSESSGKFNITLQPGESQEISVFFLPRAAHKSCSLLFLRNNLTVIEVIELNGQASHAQLKFGNRKPGSDNPLLFEITEKHLKDCLKDKTKKYFTPNLTVKRSFIVRNSGELPIFVHNFYINELKCEGYGFSVLNCASFDLPINSTRKIDVAFTPDFTLTKVHRTLILDTTLGIDVNFSLITTLPPFFLSACSSVLNRPTWEPLLYYSAISFMLFLLFCVLAAAFFESDRILKCALITMARDKQSASPLDLRQIGNNIVKEINLNSYKKIECCEHSSEKNKNKFGACHFTEWGSNAGAADSRYFTNMQKEEKSEPQSKNYVNVSDNKEKETHISTVANNFNVMQLNNINKNKKKLGKKNLSSNNTDIEQSTASHNQSQENTKRKDKNVTSTGWCDVFSQSHTFSKEKIKVKLSSLVNENVKKIRNNIESKKDEKKEEKKVNKIKKTINKELPREEEETSSTMTDSSNDAEKENADIARKLKLEKIKKNNKENKISLLQCKENSCKEEEEEECYEGCEKEKKNVVGKSTWEVNTKCNKYSTSETNSINIWKPNIVEGQQKNLDLSKQKSTKNTREKKEKIGSKRRFNEKVIMQKIVEPSSFRQHSSPCWEHRSFSEVVAKNDCPRLYSNIVSSKTQQQKSSTHPKSTYGECPKTAESNVSSLGPIGSKKPFSNWSPLSFNSSRNQSNFFNSEFSDSSNYLLTNSSSTLEFSTESNNVTDDSLLIDRSNFWKDHNALSQLMHQEDAVQFSMTSKENWLDYFWHSQRNIHQDETSTYTYDNQSWNTLLRNSIWDSSATTWNSHANQSRFSLMDHNSDQHFQHFNLPENETSGGHNFQDSNSSNVNDIEQSQRISSQSFFSQNQANLLNGGEFPHSQERENSLVMNGLQFDPFLSLSSIWSPKTQTPSQNSWNSNGNQ